MAKKILFGQVGKLKPEKVEEYEALHGAPWKEVLDTIRACNLHNYSIFRDGLYVFSYFEYDGEDYDADMKKMELCPFTRKWWTYTKPCFEKFAIRPDSEFYADMKPIFYCE